MKRRVYLLMIVVIAVIISSQVVAFGSTNTVEVETRYAFDEMKEDYNQKYQFDINVPEDGRMRIKLSNLVDSENWETKDIRIKVEDSAYYASQAAVRYWNIKADQADSGWISVKKGIYPITIEVPYRADLTSTSLYIDYEKPSEYIGEVENNDSFDEANIIEFEKTYEGNFSKVFSEYYDYDYYCCDVPSNGKLDLKITNTDFMYGTSAVDYILYYDDGNHNPKEILSTRDQIDKAVINKVLRVPAGRYYLFIRTEGRYSCSAYSFKINYTAESSETYEQEWNDFSGDSNLIKLNQSYIGNLYKTGDIDWYKLNLAHKGYINAETKIFNSIGGSSSDIAVTIYDEDLQKVGAETAINPGTCYIKVQGTLESGIDYQLSTSFSCYKHQYGETKVIDYAGFNDKGTTERVCTICGDIDRATISAVKNPVLSEKIFVYSGKVLKPDIIIKDTRGNLLYDNVDYTISYSSKCISIGKHNVVVKLQGKYSGEVVLYYTIVPKGTTSLKADLLNGYDDVTLQWKAVKGATGYLIHYKAGNAKRWSSAIVTKKTKYNFKNLNDGVQYKFKVIPYYSGKKDTLCYFSDDVAKQTSIYTLKKVSISKVKKSTKTKVKVSWKNISGETGYQISMSTKKSKTGKITTYKTKSGVSKVLKVKKGKKYFYKVRAYKTIVVNGKKKTVYGPWSNVKAYKLK